MLLHKQTWTQQAHPEFDNKPVAYFSMEFGLHETLPIYSGGLGVLSGDHLKNLPISACPRRCWIHVWAGIFFPAYQRRWLAGSAQ